MAGLFSGLATKNIYTLYGLWTIYAFGTIVEPDVYEWFEGKGASLIGEDPQTTKFDINTNTLETINLYNCSFTVTNSDADWNTLIYDPQIVENCKFDGNNYWGGIVEIYNSDVSCRIIGNSFERTKWSPLYIAQDSLTVSDEIIVVNNSFDGDPVEYIEFYLELDNCTIGKVYFYNNIFKNVDIYLTLDTMTIIDFIHDHNISTKGYIYEEDGLPFSPDVTEITDDPLYLGTDPDNRLEIDESSPAYLTGITRSDVPSTDLLGNPFSNPPSRGAYEPVESLSADFTSDKVTGDANLLVSFTDLSVGDPIEWDWDFGDGSPHSTDQNPPHVYTKAGTHTVTLTIFNGSIYNSKTVPDYITVNMVADFTSQNDVGPADLTVSFFDTSLGEPTSWDWDFGDGSPHSTDQNPTHVYTDAGIHTVTLTATRGSFNDTSTGTVTVYTLANFQADPRTGYNSLSVQFVDLSKGSPSSWLWNFGDGNTSTDQNPLHLYTSPGVYSVTLVATSFFNSDQEVKTGYIIVSGTATPDIAPEPDILLYLGGNTEVFKNTTGLRMIFVNKNQTE
jgi:PKD repeat protein